MVKSTKILALFDVDGTLTEPRKKAQPELYPFLEELRAAITIGVVGGSDFPKQKEQLGENALDLFDFNFAENGLTAFKLGKPLPSQSLKDYYGEEKLKKFINFCLGYLAQIDIPIKRGTFIEFRNGMLNISPIGRNCSQSERDDFEKYDKEHEVRKKMIEALKKEFPNMDLKYSIGGQISFDVFPVGWDKTYCLRHLKEEGFEEIHFFGDKTFEGGNDFEIFTHPEVKGHTVKSWQDTVQQCRELFLK